MVFTRTWVDAWVEQLGEACGVDTQKCFLAGDLAGSDEPYGDSDLRLYVTSLLGIRVDGLIFTLFAGGRDLSPSTAGYTDRSFVL